jgi:hypothetical protein
MFRHRISGILRDILVHAHGEKYQLSIIRSGERERGINSLLWQVDPKNPGVHCSQDDPPWKLNGHSQVPEAVHIPDAAQGVAHEDDCRLNKEEGILEAKEDDEDS